MNQFLEDVLKGLTAKEKFLQSKYFYDEIGDTLFQKIMASKEYYLTRCEMEIFQSKTYDLVKVLIKQNKEFDLIELGAGDATKSFYLLKELLHKNIHFTYFPVDISDNVIKLLEQELPSKLPGLQMRGMNGEYFQMLEKAKTQSDKMKVVIFLGSNIGNVPYEKAGEFINSLRNLLKPGDLVLIGFDLKKDPGTILNAYNDSAGFTSQFNCNLLIRINRDLDANFEVSNFYHFPTYDPSTGACKSFLISKTNQEVSVAGNKIHFYEGEPVFMEISQKYALDQTDHLALTNGFEPVHYFYDSKKWFLDVIWKCV